jgi:hypothetical protein
LHEKFNVDYRAIGQLRELAEAGYDGYRQANMLIGKLVKAVNDDKAIGSRSAFMNKCVKNAWIDLWEERTNVDPEGVYIANRIVLTGMD